MKDRLRPGERGFEDEQENDRLIHIFNESLATISATRHGRRNLAGNKDRINKMNRMSFQTAAGKSYAPERRSNRSQTQSNQKMNLVKPQTSDE